MAAEPALPVRADAFMRRLLVELAGSLEGVAGHEEASGYIGLAAQRVGDAIGEEHMSRLGPRQRFDRHRITAALTDLYRGIDGDLHVVSSTAERIVLANRTCPFGASVRGLTSLCTLTSSLVGNLAARDTGYARVDLAETIAGHGPRCLIVVDLRPSAEEAPGEEYFAHRPAHDADAAGPAC